MKIFLDTSSLIKLYHKESNSEKLEQLFSILRITNVFLAEISKIEFASAIWKKVRTDDILESDATKILQLFENDSAKYSFISIDNKIIEQAKLLITKYKQQGLRTLDSIQLASAISFKNEIGLYVTADTLLQSCFLNEELPIEVN